MSVWRSVARVFGFHPSRETVKVPTYGWSYYDHLLSLYVTLNASDPRADAVINKASSRPSDFTWGDIFLLENIVFSLTSPEIIDRSAWIIRERFREIAGPAVFEKYLDSNIPHETDTPAKLALLRADLARVLDVLHWYYSLIPMREQIRKSLTLRCIAYVVLYTVALFGILVACHHYTADFLATVASVVYWGILGGFVSSQRRMQNTHIDGDPLLSVFGLDSASYYLWLSPLLGAIFAVVLLLMFMGGILSGTVFPEFSNVANNLPHRNGLTFFSFTWKTLPISSGDYAKLFIWAFLAGFAERLVPDSLDRLSSKIVPPDKKKVPGHPPANTPAHHPGTPGSVPAPQITPDVLDQVLHAPDAVPAGGNGQS